MAPGSIFHHICFRSTILRSFIFRSINQKPQKYLATIYLLLFSFTFYNLLYLSLSDLTISIDGEGIDHPFIALGASVWLFVQVHRLETCLYLLLDWYLGSLTDGNTYLYFAASLFPLQGKTNASLRTSKKNFQRCCRGDLRQVKTYQVPIIKLSSLALHYSPFASRFPLPTSKTIFEKICLFSRHSLVSLNSSFFRYDWPKKG